MPVGEVYTGHVPFECPAQDLSIPAITENLHHESNLGESALREALDLSLDTWQDRGTPDGRPH